MKRVETEEQGQEAVHMCIGEIECLERS
jgi:hypothetical protein